MPAVLTSLQSSTNTAFRLKQLYNNKKFNFCQLTNKKFKKKIETFWLYFSYLKKFLVLNKQTLYKKF